MKHSFTLTTVVILLCLAASAQGDEIIVSSNNTLRGRVTVDDVDSVEIKTSEGSLKYKQDQVKEIIYQDTPPAYNTAVSRMELKNYNAAIAAYEEALQADHNPLLTQYILFGLARAYAGSGDSDKALEYFTQLQTQSPKNKFLFQTIETSVRLKIQKKDWDGALGDVNKLKQSAPDRAALLNAEILEGKGDLAGAASEYDKTIKNTEGFKPDLYSISIAGRLRVAYKQKKYDDFDAIGKTVRERPEDISDTTKASFFYYSGLSNLDKGRQNPEYLDRALDDFVRVFVLYNTPETKNMAAEACFRAGELCEIISTRNQPQLRDEGKKLFAYCVKAFRGTQWAEQARAKAR